jgi:hypothetical protein
MWITDDGITCIQCNGRRNVVGWWCWRFITRLLLRRRLMLLWGSISVVLLLARRRLLVPCVACRIWIFLRVDGGTVCGVGVMLVYWRIID